MVYTDSVFWLSEAVYPPLLSWYKANSPLQQELDAYAHILPCFGTRHQQPQPLPILPPSNPVTDDLRNVDSEDLNNNKGDVELTKTVLEVDTAEKHQDGVTCQAKYVTCVAENDHTSNGSINNDRSSRSDHKITELINGKRMKINNDEQVIVHTTNRDYLADMKRILKDKVFKVIVLNNSKFYHLGSMKEYIENFTQNNSFLKEMNIDSRNHTNYISHGNPTSNGHDSLKKKNTKHMIIDTYFRAQPTLGNTSHVVIEWCQVSVHISIPDNVIISNCVISDCPLVQLPSGPIELYPNCLYHTVPILDEGVSFYVTSILSLFDDIKFASEDLSMVKYFGRSLPAVIEACKHTESDVTCDGDCHSLWTLKLFPRGRSPAESFWRSFVAVSCLNDGADRTATTPVLLPSTSGDKLYSLKDVVKLKDLPTFLKERLQRKCF